MGEFEGASVILMNGNLIVILNLILQNTSFIILIVFFISIPPSFMHLFTLAFFPCGPCRSGESRRGRPLTHINYTT